MPSGHGKDVPRRIGCMSVPQKRLRRWLPERAVAVRLEATTKRRRWYADSSGCEGRR